jgi:hypothetical protein
VYFGTADTHFVIALLYLTDHMHRDIPETDHPMGVRSTNSVDDMYHATIMSDPKQVF